MGVMLSAADREIRFGIWKVHILHHAAVRQVWGTWLLEELAEHGHRLSPGTLYPALVRMETNGWLRRVGAVRHARARRPYRITQSGRTLLTQLRREVSELYREVVVGSREGNRVRKRYRGQVDRTRTRPRSAARAKT
jgi:PadR family transcriptional regulator